MSPEQVSQLEMHSVLNVYNVLVGELTVLGLVIGGDENFLRRGLAVSGKLLENLRDPQRALADAGQLDGHLREILAEIEEVLAARPQFVTDPEVIQSRQSLQAVCDVLQVRARELLGRLRTPERWERIAVAQLQRNFAEVFMAIEQHSRGRYRIIYNAALQGPKDYYFDFRIDSSDHEFVHMPPVFQDVMRDLVANARKYTPPGGAVTASLYSDAERLRLIVRDTGCGIPAEDLQRVVRFGERGSNVGHVRALGGGFGLTKAFWATKQFGGRFWIGSKPGVGTTVRIEVPVPGDQSDAPAAPAAQA